MRMTNEHFFCCFPYIRMCDNNLPNKDAVWGKIQRTLCIQQLKINQEQMFSLQLAQHLIFKEACFWCKVNFNLGIPFTVLPLSWGIWSMCLIWHSFVIICKSLIHLNKKPSVLFFAEANKISSLSSLVGDVTERDPEIFPLIGSQNRGLPQLQQRQGWIPCHFLVWMT